MNGIFYYYWFTWLQSQQEKNNVCFTKVNQNYDCVGAEKFSPVGCSSGNNEIGKDRLTKKTDQSLITGIPPFLIL